MGGAVNGQVRGIAGLALATMVLVAGGEGLAAPSGFIVDSASNCGTSNPFPRGSERIGWQGECRAGKLHGRGLLIWYENAKEYERNDGIFVDGELDGEAVVTFANGNRIYGSYKHGIRDGEFTVVRPDGKLIRATYLNGAFVTERLLRPEEAAAFDAERQRIERQLATPAAMPNPVGTAPPRTAAPIPATPIPAPSRTAAPIPVAPIPVAPIPATPPAAAASRGPAPLMPPPVPVLTGVTATAPTASAPPLAAPPLAAPPLAAPPLAAPPLPPPPAAPALQAARPAPATRGEAPIRLRPPPGMADETPRLVYGPETLVVDSASARNFPRQPGKLRLELGRSGSAPAAQTPPVMATATQVGQRFAIRIVDWPVADAVALLFGAVIKRPYRLDPAVAGRITLTPAQPIASAEATAALAQALRPIGAALVAANDWLIIVPDNPPRR